MEFITKLKKASEDKRVFQNLQLICKDWRKHNRAMTELLDNGYKRGYATDEELDFFKIYKFWLERQDASWRRQLEILKPKYNRETISTSIERKIYYHLALISLQLYDLKKIQESIELFLLNVQEKK